MKIIITGRHVEVPKKFNQYVRKRLAKWADFLDQATVHVVVTVENYRHTVEVVTQAGRHSITAKQTTKDMFQSLDLLAEKFGRQLERQHEKRVGKKKTGRILPASEIAALHAEPRGPESKNPVIDVEPWAGKPMTQEEAAIQLQSLRQPFLVFEDAESGQLAVITKQKNGTFRLIVKE